MDLNVSGFIIFYKLLDLFKIYTLKHTGVTIYLTILLQERTVILYQIAPSRISSQITVYFMLIYIVYAPSSSKADNGQSTPSDKG